MHSNAMFPPPPPIDYIETNSFYNCSLYTGTFFSITDNNETIKEDRNVQREQIKKKEFFKGLQCKHRVQIYRDTKVKLPI